MAQHFSVLRFSIAGREISVAYNKVFILCCSPGVLNTITSQTGAGHTGTLAHWHTAHRASVGSPEERSERPCMLAWSGVNSSHKTISLSLSWQSAGAAQWWVVFWYEFLSVSLACLPRDDLLAGCLTMFCPSKTGKSISCHFPVFVSLQSPPVTKSARNFSCLSGLSLRRERVL